MCLQKICCFIGWLGPADLILLQEEQLGYFSSLHVSSIKVTYLFIVFIILMLIYMQSHFGYSV